MDDMAAPSAQQHSGGRRASSPAEPLRGPLPGPGRVPPHDSAAEAALLGAMLLSSEAVAEAMTILEPEDFYRPVHARIYEAACGLTLAGEPVDAVSVTDKLPTDVLEAAGGLPGLMALTAETPASSHAARYIDIVRSNAVLRRMISAGIEIADMGYNRPEDVSAATDAAERLLLKVTQGRDRTEPEAVGAMLENLLATLESFSDASLTGVPTGFHELDDLLGGLQPRAMYVVGARPAMGKTAFALNLLTHAAKVGRPVLLFSLEVGKADIASRILAAEARIDIQEMRRSGNQHITADTWDRVVSAIDMLHPAPLYIDENPYLNILHLTGRARRFKTRLGDLGLVAVDYLQLMESARRGDNRQAEVAEISRGLKLLAGSSTVRCWRCRNCRGASRTATTNGRCSLTCATRARSNKTPTW